MTTKSFVTTNRNAGPCSLSPRPCGLGLGLHRGSRVSVCGNSGTHITPVPVASIYCPSAEAETENFGTCSPSGRASGSAGFGSFAGGRGRWTRLFGAQWKDYSGYILLEGCTTFAHGGGKLQGVRETDGKRGGWKSRCSLLPWRNGTIQVDRTYVQTTSRRRKNCRCR